MKSRLWRFIYIIFLICFVAGTANAKSFIKVSAKQGLGIITATKQEMPKGNLSAFPFSYEDYNCMTGRWEVIVSAGYTNIIEWRAPKKGRVYIDPLIVSLNGNAAGRSVELSVTDSEGIVINNGGITELNEGKTSLSINVPVIEIDAGESIFVIIHGISGYCNSLQCMGAILFCEDGSENWERQDIDGWLWPINTPNVKQGDNNFYYLYATDYQKHDSPTEPVEEIIPGNPAVPVPNNNVYPTYKILFDAENMVSSTSHASFSWSMPGKEYICMTNPAGEKITTKGYANILTWRAGESGQLDLENATVSLYSADATIIFAITDKQGNILYPKDATLSVLDMNRRSISGNFIRSLVMNPGDEVNFIFEGVQGQCISIGFEGELAFTPTEKNKVRLSKLSGQIYPQNGSTAQGESGFFYRYAKTFENVQIGTVDTTKKPIDLGVPIYVGFEGHSGNIPDYIVAQ